MPTFSPPKRWTLALLALFALAVAAWFAWFLMHRGAGHPAPKAEAVAVSTVQVQSQAVPQYLSGVGSVTANASVIVKTRVDGELEKIGFVEGQDVKAGQMLAQLDPRTLQTQLAQVRAQKARDQAQLANARIDLLRYTTLQQQDAATQQQLDTQKSLVAQLAAALQTDDAQIAFAQVQLGFTTIRAPIDGRVGARLVDAGNIVHATDSGGLVVINQIDPITVLFTLPEEAVPAINRAQNEGAVLKVSLAARDSTQELASGTLILLNNQIDTSSGTVQLKGRFANPRHQLWPGQYVNAKLFLNDKEQVLTVPAAAIQRNQDGTYVYAVDANGSAQIRPVQVARIQDGIAVIGKGLKRLQRVVVDGQYKLKPGTPVREAPAAKGAAQ